MVEQDLQQVLIWRNSDRIRQVFYTDHIVTESEHRAWFEQVCREKRTFHYLFEYDGRPVGVVNVNRINQANQTCHWGFYIGDTDVPRGTASAMGCLALDEIFTRLNLRKITGETLATNPGSIKYHLRLGFVLEGTLREQVLKDNEPIDVLTFGLIKKEWEYERSSQEEKVFDTVRVG